MQLLTLSGSKNKSEAFLERPSPKQFEKNYVFVGFGICATICTRQSSHVKRFSVSCMRDYSHMNCVPIENCTLNTYFYVYFVILPI